MHTQIGLFIVLFLIFHTKLNQKLDYVTIPLSDDRDGLCQTGSAVRHNRMSKTLQAGSVIVLLVGRLQVAGTSERAATTTRYNSTQGTISGPRVALSMQEALALVHELCCRCEPTVLPSGDRRAAGRWRTDCSQPIRSQTKRSDYGPIPITLRSCFSNHCSDVSSKAGGKGADRFSRTDNARSTGLPVVHPSYILTTNSTPTQILKFLLMLEPQILVCIYRSATRL